MTKRFIIIFILIFSCWLAADIDISFSKWNVQISGSFNTPVFKNITGMERDYLKISADNSINTNINGFDLPVHSRFVALPATGNFSVDDISYDINTISLDNKILPFADGELTSKADFESDNWLPQKIITIGSPVIMRGERFVQITVCPVQYNPARNDLRYIQNLHAQLSLDHSDQRNPLYRSDRNSNLNNLLKTRIIGRDNLRPVEKGQYLFIAPDSCFPFLEPLLRWKEKLGYSTHFEAFEEIGSTAEDLKAYLQNAYDNWEIPPEYVVLVGDIDGNFVIPSNYVVGYLYPWCVTDHNYTLLEGDDYFPDILIGRLSVRSDMELMSIVSKLINYEKNPYTATEWFKSALMVGYVDESNGFSQRETLLAIRDKFLDFEYAKVDTFISPWQHGSNALMQNIENGHSFVCYRGAGHSTYWSGGALGQMLTSNHVLNLNNGYMLPMVTSMTCGGGDFAAVEAPSCFGETWLKVGTPTVPQGAIGFIGPSERDTKTWFNNANAMGIYQGITQEGITRCGEMLLRGKMELYNNYPFGHDFGGAEDSDQFYFYVYNLLGDPGLQVWTDTPKVMELEVDDYTEGMNFVSAQVNSTTNDLSGFTIAVTSHDDLIATGTTDFEGKVNIPVILSGDSYHVTASKYGYIPVSVDLSVSSGNDLGVQDFSLSSIPAAGVTLDVDLDIYNYSHTPAEDIEVELLSTDEAIAVISELIAIPALPANDSTSVQFQIEISEHWQNGLNCELNVLINSSFGEDLGLIPVNIQAPELIFAGYSVQNSSGCLIQNEQNDLYIDLLNIGSVVSSDVNLELHCLNEAVEIISNTSGCNSLQPDQISSSTTPFSVISSNLMSGEIAAFELKIFKNETLLQTTYFDIPVGIIDQTSPTFSDTGYYAIESNDIGNFEPPVYDWVEINPALGAAGTRLNGDHVIIDGFTKTLSLPFSVRYFGKYYSKITVCSEGYISMGESPHIFFRNRYIPSGVGPSAMIAPFWDSLVDGEIYVYHDMQQNRFIVEWFDCGNAFDPTQRNTFQVIFFDPDHYGEGQQDSHILFQYKEIHNIDAGDHFATIGIENENQTSGLLMTFAGIETETAHPIESGTAIKFYSKPDLSIPYLTSAPEELYVFADSDTTVTLEVELSNQSNAGSDLEYELSFSHFSRDLGRSENIVTRSLENDFITQLSGQYIPVMPMDMLFYLVHNSPDEEPITGVRIDFPPGFYVNTAYDFSDLGYNGETGDGALVSWGFGNGNALNQGSPFSTKVNLTIEPDLPDPVFIDWYIEGDGSGQAPHSVSGILQVYSTEDDHLWITHPNGGETVLPGLQDTIRWNHYGELTEVKIELQREEQGIFEIISSTTENDGEYSHIFTGPLSSECKLKISSPDEETVDTSDSLFSISALNITYPISETVMSYDTLDSLVWEDIGGIEFVDIELSFNNALTWKFLAEDIPNTGKYLFTVPGPPSPQCVIRISSQDFDCQNQSDQFTIADSPVEWLNSPVNTGTIPANQSETITINVSTTDLEFGSYHALVKLKTDIGQIHYIPVTLEYVEQMPQPPQITLSQNHPNPFNPFTKIDYSILSSSLVKLEIYNIKGQLIKTLVDEVQPAGEYFTFWNGTDKYERKVSSGVYFYKLSADSNTKTRKMLLIK